MEYVDEHLGSIVNKTVRNISEVEKGYTYFEDRDVLFAKITPCMENGKCAIASHLLNGIGFGSTEFHIIRSKSEIISEWIYYFLRQESVRYQAERRMTGSAGQKRVPSSFLEEELCIPLPPLPEQQRIAVLLGKADRLRRLRRYALEMSAGYLQAVFVEMFGDTFVNPFQFPLVQFDEICESRLGKMLDAKQQTGMDKRLYLRNVNVKWGQFDLSDLAEMDFDEADREEFRLKKGDVLICEGGEVGRAAIWNNQLPECYYQKALHRVRPNPKFATSEFIFGLMRCLAKNGGLGDFTSQVTIAHLTGEKLKTIRFPLPPLSLQQKFIKVMHKHERLHAQQREALRQAEHLFQTLLARSFGENR